jgi:Holliday junction resolvasome RuvABC endonuclease subunit
MILGIDPGNKETGLVLIDEQRIPTVFDKVENIKVREWIIRNLPLPAMFAQDFVGIESIASYGMAVGAEVFETAEWSGRVREYVKDWTSKQNIYRVYRKQVKLNLCGTTKAKDGNIRQALIDRYPAIGGGKCPQIGTKKEQGPLYGLHSDLWAALAVAHTVADMKDELTNWK